MTDLVFWAAVAVVGLGVALLVAAPLLRAGERMGRSRRAGYDLAVFRDQLAEVDRDRDAGRLDETEAQAARSEIERRMLRTVDRQADGNLADGEGEAGGLGVAFPLALGLVVAGASVALYLNIGQPGLDDAPLAGRTDLGAATAQATQGDVDGRNMIQSLRERLAANPNDAAGWVTLARTHRVMNEHPEAVKAFERAIEILGQAATAELISDYGEALVFEAFGTVSPRATATFERALGLDPRDIKSRFYIAMARGQAGDYRGAIALWRGLTADAPPDAPWVEAVRERIADAAMKGGIMPVSVPPELPGETPTAPSAPGTSGLGGAIAGDAQPTQQDVAAVSEMAPEDRTAFIRSMVERLADKMQDNPDDVDGWLRLGRAYDVLGDKDDAKAAFGNAKRRLEDILANTPADSPTRPAVQATLAEVEELLAK